MAHRRPLALLLTLLLLTLLAPAGAAASPWSSYVAAQAAEAAGDLAGAAALYHEAAESYAAADPTNAAIMFGHAGRVLAQLGDLDRAAEAWGLEARYWEKPEQLQSRIAAQRKADWVRSEVRLFVSAPAGAVGNRYYTGAKHEPVTGAYLGVYAESDRKVHNPYQGGTFYTEGFGALAGRQHPISMLYGNWGTLPPDDHLVAIREAGGALELALQPMNGLASVSDGPYLHELARVLREAEIPVFLRFAGEMNGNWTPWAQQPELYKQKFRLVAEGMHREAPNVAMVWAPAWDPRYTMDQYYPGDAYVDWVGISAYGVYDPSLDPVTTDPTRQRDPRPLHDTFAEIYSLYADRKPIMLVEGGVGYFDHSVNQSREAWAIENIQRFYAAMPRLYPRVKALVWFDSDLKTSTQDKGIMKQNYLLSANERVLNAYRKAIADPFFLADLQGTAGRVYLDAVEMGVPAGKVELSSYVRAYDPFLSRVEYAIGGILVGRSTAGDPWEATVDFAPYAGQTVTVTVRAYDSLGRLAVERDLAVRVSAAAVTLDGEPIAFDYQPALVEGSLLVPVAQLAAAGTEVTATGGLVTLSRDGKRVVISAGSRTATVDGQPLELPVAPVSAGGRTLVPLRVMEWLGFTVHWDGATRTAHLQ